MTSLVIAAMSLAGLQTALQQCALLCQPVFFGPWIVRWLKTLKTVPRRCWFVPAELAYAKTIHNGNSQRISLLTYFHPAG